MDAVQAWCGCPRMGHFRRLMRSVSTRTQNRVKLKPNSIFHPSEVKMSHASMLKARRQHQKSKKLLDVAAKQAKRLAKQALAGPVVKKEKVKKIKVTKEELGRQDTKKNSAGAEQKGAS